MLRKSDPGELKKLITAAQSKVNGLPSPGNMQILGKLILTDLNSVKNNNASKLPSYDPEIVAHATRILRSLVAGKSGGGSGLQPATSFGLRDILDAPVKGRWWIVGSAFETDKFKQSSTAKAVEAQALQCSNELLVLAEKNRMNTDLRRAIFCTIMSSEDYLNAFERLLRLNLKDPQEREIIHILFICCLNERRYNPFYALVVKAFCQYHRRFSRTAQFAVWDKIKVLETMKKHQRLNFASLLASLLGSSVLAISVLRVIDFSEMQNCMKNFLKLTFTALLLENSDETLTQCFERLKDKAGLLRPLRDGIRLFLQLFLVVEGGDPALMRKVQMVDEVLVSRDNYSL